MPRLAHASLAPLLVVVFSCLDSASSRADEAPAPPPAGTYSLLDPTPDDKLRDFQPDRPGRITGPFTIDAGHLEIESDLANYLRSDTKGVTDTVLEVFDPTIKLGILSNVDVEMVLNGDEVLRQRQDMANARTRQLNGFGDVYFRAKINVLGDDGGDYALAFIPYVKVPASTPASLAIGDGVVEGGGLAVAQVKLPQDFSLGLQSEIDALEGGNDSRRHPNFVNIAALSHEIPGVKDLTGTAEIYTSVSEDRFTPSIYTVDFALAYLIRPSTQLDIGTNLGLNHAAPNYQVYAGISQRF